MIIISNTPLDIETIIYEYPENSIERDIINTMSESSEKYRYDYLDQLRFELNLRNEIINASKQLYRSRLSFKVFRYSECSPEYWNRSNDGGFVLKNGADPAEAINDIFVNGSKYGTECATAMVIVYYKALLNIFPKELFNRLFPNIYLMNWRYIDRLLRDIGFMKYSKDYFPGDRRYFDNPDVDPLTPYWQGENVIDLSGGLYYGHGIGIQNADTIIRVLNDNRKEDADEAAFLMNSASRPNFKNLANIYYDFIN